MIKIVSFDLDGTLMKSTFADLVWLEGLPQIYSNENQIDVEKAKVILKKEYDEISDYQPEWYDLSYWFNHFNLRSDWKKLLEKYRYSIESYPEVPGVVRRLFKKFDLIIISNAKREFIEIELEESKIRKYFSYVFSSTSDYHKVKKIAGFYSMICDQLNISPDEMIHVGDHEEFDYQIPRRAGITSSYLNRDRISNIEFVVSNLDEFEVGIHRLLDRKYNIG